MSEHGQTDQLLSLIWIITIMWRIKIFIIVRMPEPDCFLRYRISAPMRNFTSGKSDVYVLAAAASRGFKMVLRPNDAATRGFTMVSFTEAVSRRNTFVGGAFSVWYTKLAIRQLFTAR